MKLKFKNQPYQTAAVEAVTHCFKGQPLIDPGSTRYRVDPGEASKGQSERLLDTAGFRNAAVRLDSASTNKFGRTT